MPKLYKDRSAENVRQTDFEVTREKEYVSEEEYIPSEEFYSFDEYNEKPIKIREDDTRSHNRFKKLFLKPVISLVAVVSLVAASYGIDPLGADILNKSGTVLAGGTTTSSTAPSPIAPSGTSETTDTPGGKTDTPSDTEADTTEVTPPVTEPDDDEFPALGNLNPDFGGDFAWSGAGSEEYIRFGNAADPASSYLQKGSAWDTYDPTGTVVTDPSASYDKSTNTLTLTGFNADYLDVNLMGNGFTIELSGSNHIGTISIWGAMYGGSLKIVGDGSLTVDNGITLNCEMSESCLMVGKGVTLDISGAPALIIGDTTMKDNAVYLSKKLELTGGEIAQIGSNEYEGNKTYSYSVVDATGNPVEHFHIEPKK